MKNQAQLPTSAGLSGCCRAAEGNGTLKQNDERSIERSGDMPTVIRAVYRPISARAAISVLIALVLLSPYSKFEVLGQQRTDSYYIPKDIQFWAVWGPGGPAGVGGTSARAIAGDFSTNPPVQGDQRQGNFAPMPPTTDLAVNAVANSSVSHADAHATIHVDGLAFGRMHCHQVAWGNSQASGSNAWATAESQSCYYIRLYQMLPRRVAVGQPRVVAVWPLEFRRGKRRCQRPRAPLANTI